VFVSEGVLRVGVGEGGHWGWMQAGGRVAVLEHLDCSLLLKVVNHRLSYSTTVTILDLDL
jgi:hypothetical protein